MAATVPSSGGGPLPVAIVGGGIAGLALAVALQQRGVPCRVFERDAGFDGRKQGYGMTMQATQALADLFVYGEGFRRSISIATSDEAQMRTRVGAVREILST